MLLLFVAEAFMLYNLHQVVKILDRAILRGWVGGLVSIQEIILGVHVCQCANHSVIPQVTLVLLS